MSKQKFFRGQRVKICKDLGHGMGHFESDREAIVIGSYGDQFGKTVGRGPESYSLCVFGPRGGGGHHVSWYDEWQLTLVSDARREGEEILQRRKNF